MAPPSKHIDTTPFAALMAEALEAYATDASYAVEMAHRAVGVVQKRALWQARSQLRAAEATARSRCEAADAFVCSSPAGSPCGVGPACRFSPPELRSLAVPTPDRPVRGSVSTRPQPGPDGAHGDYALEAAVRPLARTWGVAAA